MPCIVPDTSFVISLYGRDAHTTAAQRRTRQAGGPISWTRLQHHEFANAVRLAAFRKAMTPMAANGVMEAFKADLSAGFVEMIPCDLEAVVAAAEELSALHTLGGGYRAYDILHVATACVLKADVFLSFDANQRKLAKVVGLAIGP